MLSYPDRQKFEEIRSRWEAARHMSDKPSTMVGRKEKPVTHQPLSASQSDGPSSFRRKLSYGLSFISNPLAQRKTMPVRQMTGGLSLPTHRPSVNIDTLLPRESDRLLSPSRDHTALKGSTVQRHTLNSRPNPEKILDPDATPKPLPRSRTMSFIPRPSRSGSESSVIESDSNLTLRPPVFALKQETRAMPSKIPTPSPPLPSRQRSSPRQSSHNLTTQQEKHVAAGNAFAGANAQTSPSKASIRSYTTPNLMKVPRSPQRMSFMASRKSIAQSSSGIPALPKAHLKENSTPPSQRNSKQLSQIQEKSPQRKSNVAPTAMVKNKRRTLGPTNARPQSKRDALVASPTANKRRSSQFLSQTPLAAQRASPKKQSTNTPLTEIPNANGSAIAQPRLMGVVNPPTPPVLDHAAARQMLPRASTDKDLRRRTTTTPSKHSGVGMLSRSQVRVNHEVRLPRSSTFHSFMEDRDPAPPIPSIPEQYRSPSMPVIGAVEHSSQGPPKRLRRQKNLHVDDPISIRERTAVSDEDIAATIPSFFIYEGNNTSKLKWMREQSAGHQSGRNLPESSNKETISRTKVSISNSSLNALLPIAPRAQIERTDSARLWSINDQYLESSANVDCSQQVKEYMPALYWAGRFQSRFDQWRTEAIRVQIDPNHKVAGPLSECQLNQEKDATCYIFLQLRDLCISNEAADSLWEFEYKYRQEHKMLGTTFDLPPVRNRKQDESTSRPGPFSRAVRKLTPRKSSFVNLLKGKGWNADEDLQSTDGTSGHILTASRRRKSSSDDS